MTTYIIGGGTGLIGILAGIAIALWWRYRMARAEGALTVLELKYEYLNREHTTLATTTQRALERKDAEIAGLREREEQARGSIRDWLARDDTPIDKLVDTFNGLFPAVPKKDGNG